MSSKTKVKKKIKCACESKQHKLNQYLTIKTKTKKKQIFLKEILNERSKKDKIVIINKRYNEIFHKFHLILSGEKCN